MISARTIDQLLLSFCDKHWLKVARVIGKSYEILERRGIRPGATTAKIIDMRMAALVGNGRLEAQGEIRKWRFSEVRLTARQSKQQNRIPVCLLRMRKNDNRPTRGKRVAKIQRIHLPLLILLRRTPRRAGLGRHFNDTTRESQENFYRCPTLARLIKLDKLDAFSFFRTDWRVASLR